MPSGFAAVLRTIYTTGPSLTAVVLLQARSLLTFGHISYRAGDALAVGTCADCPLRPVSRTLVPSTLKRRFATRWRFAPVGAARPFEGPAPPHGVTGVTCVCIPLSVP